MSLAWFSHAGTSAIPNPCRAIRHFKASHSTRARASATRCSKLLLWAMPSPYICTRRRSSLRSVASSCWRNASGAIEDCPWSEAIRPRARSMRSASAFCRSDQAADVPLPRGTRRPGSTADVRSGAGTFCTARRRERAWSLRPIRLRSVARPSSRIWR